jgi:4-hydroxy-tetrahydrodipicolinate reductase
MLKVAVAGAAGRMGRTLARMVQESNAMALAGGLEAPGSAYIGQDMGALSGLGEVGVRITDDPLELLRQVDAVLDFTTPAASVALADVAAQTRIVHVVGTTGLAADDEARIKAAARHARIVKSGNMSLGVNLLAALVRQAAQALGEDFDIEIVEMHHRHKVDAPSGTALLLGEAAAKGRGIEWPSRSIRGRDGQTGPRPSGDIGFAALRGGSVVGEHTVIFAGPDERLELSHSAQSRDIFARGALKAAQWAFDKKPGLYSMADVLGLGTS